MMILGNQLSSVSRDGSEFVNQLSALFEGQFGPAGGLLIKIGFFCGVLSSLLGVWQSVPYLFSDLYYLSFPEKRGPETELKKTKAYRIYLVLLGTVPLISLWLNFKTIQLLYSFIGALFIPLCALSLLLLNNSKEHEEVFRNKLPTNLILIITMLFFLYQGGLSLVGKF